MIFKVGNDIIETKRIGRLYEKFGNRFLKRVFTSKEIAYCESKGVCKYQSYAARFAGKESVFKAVSGALGSKFDLQWKDIEILNDEQGRPVVKVNKLNCKIDISLSHEKEYAIAVALVIFD